MDTDAFDLQEIKLVFLCFYIFYSLKLVPDIVIYLSFVIINKTGSSYSQIVSMITIHITALSKLYICRYRITTH